MKFFLLFIVCVQSLLAHSVMTSKGKAPSVGSFLRISGQFSPVFGHYSRGGKSANMFGTLGSSNSRIRFISLTRLANGVEAEGTLELGFNFESTLKSDPWHSSKTGIDFRKCFVALHSNAWGSIFLGQIKTATDDTAEQDCTFGMLSIPALLYGLHIHQKDAPDTSKDVAFSKMFYNYDGGSRAVGIRYDSPSFYGFTIRLGAHNAKDPNENNTNKVMPCAALIGRWKFGPKQTARSGDARFATGITKQLGKLGKFNTSGYAWSNSMSFILPCGTGMSAAYSLLTYERKPFKKKPYFWNLKLSQWLLRSTNPIAVSIEYGMCHNMHPFEDNAEWYGAADVFGLSLGQTYPSLGLDAFVAFKKVSYALNKEFDNAAKFDTTNVVLLGMRVVF